MEAVIIIDVLRRAKAEVVVASVGEKLEIKASRNVKLVADVLLEEVINKSFDFIVLPVRDGYLLIGTYISHQELNIYMQSGWTWWSSSLHRFREACKFAKETKRVE